MPQINLVGDSESLPDMVVMADVINQLLGQMVTEGREKELAPKRVGKILIKLFFSGTTTKGRRKTVESSMRLMSSKDAAKIITLDRIRYYGSMIVKKFGDWQHKTGKSLYCYADWDKGYQLQLLVPSETEAKRIVEQILDIQSHKPEWEYLSLSKNTNEAKRYPDLPNKIDIAGKKVRPPTQRAVCTVKFQRALIKFPHIPTAFPLCGRKDVLIKDLNFLNIYDD
jgi:hypothetical protein